MAQTDRQTDKATHWKSAIYDVDDNWSILQATPPSWIRFVKFKKEICPTTGKEHFQTHLACQKQVRLTKVCSWLKHTKWIACFGDAAIRNSINYIDKLETTAPGAVVHLTEGAKFYQIHELFDVLSTYSEPMVSSKDMLDLEPDSINNWKWITRRLLQVDITWTERLSNPTLRRLWADWGSLFIRRWEDRNSETMGSFIIEEPTERSEVEDQYGFLED